MQQHDSIPLGTLSTERQGGGTTAAGVSLMEVSTFMTEQLKAVARMEARMDKQASEAKKAAKREKSLAKKAPSAFALEEERRP